MNIKEIVFHHIHSLKGKVNVQALTNEILLKHPDSKWDLSHWSFYRTQIISDKGRYKHLFNEEIKNNLRALTNKPNQGLSSSNRNQMYTPVKRSATNQWPVWDIPSDEEQRMLARILVPYIKILHPDIVEAIVEDNNKHLLAWTEQLQSLAIRPDIYLWEDSPVCFPGIRRHVGRKETFEFNNNPKLSKGENAICLDDNSFPKEIWAYALRNNKYGKNNPPNYSLAHIIDHKDFKTRNTDELKGFAKSEDANLFAGLYTACTNAFYVPASFLKPTDHNSRIRLLLIQIVDKYYGSICKPLPHNLSFNLENISEEWRIENFPEPGVVGRVENVKRFIAFRNDVINSKIKELKETRKD